MLLPAPAALKNLVGKVVVVVVVIVESLSNAPPQIAPIIGIQIELNIIEPPEMGAQPAPGHAAVYSVRMSQ
jgi:hypothetical protein